MARTKLLKNYFDLIPPITDDEYEMFNEDALKEYAKMMNQPKSEKAKVDAFEGYILNSVPYDGELDFLTMRNRANMNGYNPVYPDMEGYDPNRFYDPEFFKSKAEDRERLQDLGIEGERVKEYQKSLEDMQKDQALTRLRASNLAEGKRRREEEEKKRKARHAELARFFEDPLYQIAALDYIFKGDNGGFTNILQRIATENATKASNEASKAAKEEAKADEAKRKKIAEDAENKKKQQEVEEAQILYEQARNKYSKLLANNPDSAEAQEAKNDLELKELIYKHKLQNVGMEFEPKTVEEYKDNTPTPKSPKPEDKDKPKKTERAVSSIEADINRLETEFKNDPKRKLAQGKALYAELIRVMKNNKLNATEATNKMNDFIAKVTKEVEAKDSDDELSKKVDSYVKTYADIGKRDEAWNKIDAKYRKYLTKGSINGMYAIKRSKKK